MLEKRTEFANNAELTNLEAVVKEIHPTIMIGTSTNQVLSAKQSLKKWLHTERPIIMPLSNPTKLAEATAKDLIEWTDEKP